MNIQVLLVEDNLSLSNTVIDYLALEGIGCDHVASGVAGLRLAKKNPYQTVVLDINLPRMNGFEVCEALREEGVDTPILMLTARRDTLEDKLTGFDAGTDDYLVKPFELKELVVRIQALANRKSAQARILTVGELSADLSKKRACRSGKTLDLTPTGWIILELLMRQSPEVVTRDRLAQAIWDGDDLPDSSALKVHLYRLRQQVDKPFDQQMIQTVANHGVFIDAPER